VTCRGEKIDIAYSSTITKLQEHPHGSIIHIHDGYELQHIIDGLAKYEQDMAEMFIAYALHMYEGKSLKEIEGIVVSIHIEKPSMWKKIKRWCGYAES
jgi:hypothetical protein